MLEKENVEYEIWLGRVEKALWGMAEMSLADFLKFDFLALYEVGSTPSQAADAALLSIEFSRFS